MHGYKTKFLCIYSTRPFTVKILVDIHKFRVENKTTINVEIFSESIENIKSEMKRNEEGKKIGALSCREVKAIFRKRDKLKPHIKESTTKYTDFGKNLLQKCGHIPLYSLHAINCILNSKIQRSFDEYELNGWASCIKLSEMRTKPDFNYIALRRYFII